MNHKGLIIFTLALKFCLHPPFIEGTDVSGTTELRFKVAEDLTNGSKESLPNSTEPAGNLSSTTANCTDHGSAESSQNGREIAVKSKCGEDQIRNFTRNNIRLGPGQLERETDEEYKQSVEESNMTQYIGWAVFAGMILLIGFVCGICLCFDLCKQKYNQRLIRKYNEMEASSGGNFDRMSTFEENGQKDSDDEYEDNYQPPPGFPYGPPLSGGWTKPYK